ncbi:DUF6644 family protein [Methylobacter tundripaludum]|uniref:DUF6644 family protein n=1 Tax=Methylobacter tundripaludum TaxID=173365 RepID=UPI0004877A55|nr:DUF6644 family protein [Methylobacter tundripaludum]
MSTLELFKALQASNFGRFIGSLDHLVHAGIQLMHIIGLLLLLSSIVLVSLRLLGLGLRTVLLTEIADVTNRFIWIGLALLVISGVLMLAPSATNYYENDFFWDKLVLLGLALLVHVTLFRKVIRLEHTPAIAAPLAVLSLLLWFGVAFAGRFIGFF